MKRKNQTAKAETLSLGRSQQKSNKRLKSSRVFLNYGFLSIVCLLLLTACQSGEKNIEDKDEVSQSTSVTDQQEDDNDEETETEPTDQEKLAAAIEARDQEDEIRQQENGEFYVPLPEITSLEDLEKTPKTIDAKALYVTGNIAGFSFDQANIDLYSQYIEGILGQTDQTFTEEDVEDVNRLEKILALCETTEINALVIDVKNDDGMVKWDSDIEGVNDMGSDANAPFKNVDTLMDYLKDHDIYTIARIVAFKDPFFAENNEEHTIQLTDGGIYRDSDGVAWVNPFDEYVWKYDVALAQEAANRGFDEIQYDYVRFPDNAATYNPITTFPGRDGRNKDEAIESFLTYAKEQLEAYHVNLSADVFAQITRSWDDSPEDIGQTWRKISNVVNYISPMIYPSHYGTGVYGFDVPDQHPFEVIHNALSEAIERNSAQESPASIRPWIQGFNATWISGHIDYDGPTIAQQVLAAKQMGIDAYIIWDPSNTYDPDIFNYTDQEETMWPLEGQDMAGRTAQETMERYLKAQKNDKTSQLYLMTPVSERVSGYDDFKEDFESQNLVVGDYEIESVEKKDEDTYEASVDVTYSSNEGEAELVDAIFTIKRENGIFKVYEPTISWENPEDYPLGLLPNEEGQIMILMYHNVGDEEEEWVRTPDHVREDLEALYEEGYRPISLVDYASGTIKTEAGYTPVVITIDDANPNNFTYLDDGEIDPDCLVGIFMEFSKEHPDFPLEATFFVDGPRAFGATSDEEEAKMLNTIVDAGMDIGNHTLNHESMKELSADEIQEAIGAQKEHLESLINQDGYEVNTLALPYGEHPEDDSLSKYLMQGSYAGETYQNLICLNVGSGPALSPYDEDYDASSVPRIRASRTDVGNVGLYDYLATFEKHPDRRFISDGQ